MKIYIATYLPWILSVITIYSMWITGNKNKIGWLVGTGKVYWCEHCDNALVGHGTKCPACKKRNGKRTLKKETNA